MMHMCRIRETMNMLECADNSTNTKINPKKVMCPVMDIWRQVIWQLYPTSMWWLYPTQEEKKKMRYNTFFWGVGSKLLHIYFLQSKFILRVGEGGGTNERPETDHVTPGPIRAHGKNCTRWRRQTDIRKWQLYD